MEDIAARHAAELLLAAHKANLRFERLASLQPPATISDAYDIQEKYVGAAPRRAWRHRRLQGRIDLSCDAGVLRN